jgi:molybdopterin molybdotransferase
MSDEMISVETARALLLKAIKPNAVISIPVKKSTGFVLAANIKSPVFSPPFNQSAMDGYAFRFRDVSFGLKVIGQSTAGRNFKGKIGDKEAVRIFTGAAVPEGADTVVMQEKCLLNKDIIFIDQEGLKEASNIRLKGSSISKNEIAADKHSVVRPAAIGFLASLGIQKVNVFMKPSVSIIVTGDELRKPGTKLSAGQIFESNSYTLVALLKENGIKAEKILFAKDNLADVRAALQKALKVSTIVLFTGGISAGDYDFTAEAADLEKVKTVFYRIKQKPGKPLFFGSRERQLVFGLPGNPAAVVSCFYQYVYPAIRICMGDKKPFLKVLHLPVTNGYNKKQGLTHFLKAYTDFNNVTILEGQESYKMQSFNQANCLVELPEEVENVLEGEPVQVHLLHMY